jgi:hypothetical protein
MTKTRLFTTLDIYLSAFISLHDLDPVLEIANGKVVFVFEATDSLYKLMNDFNSNESVDVADYTTAIKTLRGKMLSMKQGITDNGKGRNYGAFNH